MKARPWLAAGLALLMAAPAPAQDAAAARAAQDDPILRAMRDEMARSSKLVAGALPYYIQYSLEDSESFSATAVLGGLLSSRPSHIRQPRVQVRVGTPEFDNTNFVFSDMLNPSPLDAERFPLDNAYPVLRQSLWLATDRAFKGAVQAFNQKQAALRNVTESAERLPDFAKAPVVRVVRPVAVHRVDESAANDRVRRLSAEFARFPEVLTSLVEYQQSTATLYVLNSDGGVLRLPDSLAFYQIRAQGLAPDGMPVRDLALIQALEPGQLPAEERIKQETLAVAQTVAALAKAPLGEDYTGPVLFEGAAAPQLFGQVIGAGLVRSRKPVTPAGRSLPNTEGELEGRYNSKVLPESFDVVDDPTQRQANGRPLLGFYEADLEAVAPVPVTLVEKGKLVNFLYTRQPVPGYKASNGHARLPGNFGAFAAHFSNLFIRSTEGVPAAELKQRLIKLCQERGKPYGLIVRKLDYPSAAPVEEVRRMVTAAGSASRIISSPVRVYKVYPDGREELVRGMRFRNFSARLLRDIVAASTETTQFDVQGNGLPMAFFGAAPYVAPASIVAPAILVDEVELEPVREEQFRPPVVPPPALTPSER